MSEIAQLKRDEGFSQFVYKDSNDNDTIGFGLCLKYGISKEIAAVIMTMQLEEKKVKLKKSLPWLALAPIEVTNVLSNMSFQLGVTGVKKFKKTLKYLKNEQYTDASIEMLDSKWARNHKTRSKRLSRRIKAVGICHGRA